MQPIPGLGLYELEPIKTAYTLSNIYLDGIDLRSVRLDETNTGYLWVSTGIGLIHFDTRLKTFETWNVKTDWLIAKCMARWKMKNSIFGSVPMAG